MVIDVETWSPETFRAYYRDLEVAWLDIGYRPAGRPSPKVATTSCRIARLSAAARAARSPSRRRAELVKGTSGIAIATKHIPPVRVTIGWVLNVPDRGHKDRAAVVFRYKKTDSDALMWIRIGDGRQVNPAVA
jgi:hypothetical protein